MHLTLIDFNKNQKDKKLNGLFEEYHENGGLKSKGNYKDGLKTGLWHKCHENGQLLSEGCLKMEKNMVFGKSVMKMENQRLNLPCKL